MRKPNRGDYKYLGLDLKTAEREFERDMILWEQAESLEYANELKEAYYDEMEYQAQQLQNDLNKQRNDLRAKQDELNDTLNLLNENIEQIKQPSVTPVINNDTNNTDEVALAIHMNINYLLIKKLYKLIKSYTTNPDFMKQLLLTWIEFRQNHYDYDYEAFIDEYRYDDIIKAKYTTTHFPIKPISNGTKEDYETMIKKMIRAILNN